MQIGTLRWNGVATIFINDKKYPKRPLLTQIRVDSFRICSDFNALDILNCERHLSASSKAESKLATSSFTEFAIFRIFPQELSV